jgi:hypothetical protein
LGPPLPRSRRVTLSHFTINPGHGARKRVPAAPRRRALELLASSVRLHGSDSHGFTVAQMVKLVRLGLAPATAERVIVSARTVGGAKLRITAKGWQRASSSWSPITPSRLRTIPE